MGQALRDAVAAMQQAPAQAAQTLLAGPLARLGQLESALAWLEQAAPLYDRAMAQVTSSSAAEYVPLAAAWEGLDPEARAYCDPAARPRCRGPSPGRIRRPGLRPPASRRWSLPRRTAAAMPRWN